MSKRERTALALLAVAVVVVVATVVLLAFNASDDSDVSRETSAQTVLEREAVRRVLEDEYALSINDEQIVGIVDDACDVWNGVDRDQLTAQVVVETMIRTGDLTWQDGRMIMYTLGAVSTTSLCD